MWYAVDIDEGIINTFDTLREGVKYYSDNGKSKRLGAGLYEVTNKGNIYIKTTFLIKSTARETAEQNGFGWVFERRQ